MEKNGGGRNESKGMETQRRGAQEKGTSFSPPLNRQGGAGGMTLAGHNRGRRPHYPAREARITC